MNFHFITATREFNSFEKHVPAPYIRKSFFCEEETVGKLRVAACGFYELYFNGKKITKGYLAPYISNTDDYVYYDEYTVTLDKGENVIGLLLGNGYQNNPGGYIWDFDKASFRSAPKVAVELTYKTADGKQAEILSDTDFKSYPSPIIFDDYRFGEGYDARLELAGWCDRGFDDSKWKSVLKAEPPLGELRLCTAQPIVKETELKPVNIFKEDDSYIYDFGVSNAGVCRLCINGEPNQKITLQHTDLLLDGRFYFKNIWFDREWERDREIVHTDTYICAGGRAEYTPTFTYHGFRYVKVTGITEAQATEDLLRFVVFHSDLKSRGGFSCSDSVANRLQEMTRRSDLSNFHYFPTDCPQREKNGWTADAALSCEQLLLNFNPELSYREWLNNIRKAQDENGALPGIIPTTGWGFKWGNGPAWDCVLVYLPYFTYVYRGETKMITDSVGAFVRYFKYLASQREDRGLLHIGLGDWCHVGRDVPKAPLEVTDSIISMDIASKAAFLLQHVGKLDEAKFISGFADEMRRAVREHLINFDTMTVKGECQTSQAMGLFYGVFEPCEEQAAFNVLLELIHAENDFMDVGVLGGRVIFHVLSRFGYSDLAYKMITRPEYPSYGNWVERGATTLWENFSPDSVWSPNHHFWGDISAWFIKCIAGIHYNPTAKNLNFTLIAPHFIETLQNASGFYESPRGKISVSWERDGEEVVLSVKAPSSMDIKLSLENYIFEDGAAEKEISPNGDRVYENMLHFRCRRGTAEKL